MILLTMTPILTINRLLFEDELKIDELKIA